MMWRLLVIAAVLVVVASFVFVFVPQSNGPDVLGLPYALWSGILATVLLVVLTYLGSRLFPYKEN